MVTREGNIEGWVKKVKGSRSTNLYLQKNYKGVQNIIGHRVKNIIIIMCGASGILKYWGDHSVNYLIVTNMLYAKTYLKQY